MLCSEIVCQNIQPASCSAGLCVMCLALLSSGLQISIHPTRVAFKLLWEAVCFVTHNNLLDYCVGLLSKIDPVFRLLTCCSVLFSRAHIAETSKGFGNITWPYNFLNQVNLPISNFGVFHPNALEPFHLVFQILMAASSLVYVNYYFMSQTSDDTRQQQRKQPPDPSGGLKGEKMKGNHRITDTGISTLLEEAPHRHKCIQAFTHHYFQIFSSA